MPSSKLYIIATPIGNREDITQRALDSLRKLRFFLVEDTREFLKLLSLYEISSKEKIYHSYAQHNEKEATQKALAWLEKGEDIGVLSDRGTPGISDPGASMVQEARARGYSIVPIPGASAVTALMSVSGFYEKEFHFIGFLPKENAEQEKLWMHCAKNDAVTVFYESPQRIASTLKNLAKLHPEAFMVVGREMTKSFETFYTGPVQKLLDTKIESLGEFACAIRWPKTHEVKAEVTYQYEEVLELLNLPPSDSSKKIAKKFSLNKKDVYQDLLDRKENA